MSVRPLNKRFALIVALYNCRKRDNNMDKNLLQANFLKKCEYPSNDPMH